jgi:mannose-6-phosphate isomerase-like protein (cupin superfamily)
VPDSIQLGPHETLEVLERGPAALVLDARWEARGAPPPAHLHPSQDEHFEVLEGELTAELAGEERRVRSGEKFDVPRGTPHRMWNAGDHPARARWETRPAGRTEEWFRALGGLLAGGAPDPEALAALVQEYRDTFRLAEPPTRR